MSDIYFISKYLLIIRTVTYLLINFYILIYIHFLFIVLKIHINLYYYV